MVHFRLDLDANRIYSEVTKEPVAAQTGSLQELLPLTRPGFTVLVDLSPLAPPDLASLELPEQHCIEHGMARCAYLSPSCEMLGMILKKIRRESAAFDCGYFTRLEDALQYLTPDPPLLTSH